MGGPFVSHVHVDRTNGRIVVVEGFVYNPGKLKRDQIRKLNAALYTLKLPQEKEVGELPVDNQISEEKVMKDRFMKYSAFIISLINNLLSCRESIN